MAPDPSDDSRTEADLLHADDLRRLNASEDVDFDAWCAEHKDHAEALRDLHARNEALANGDDPGSTPSAEFLDQLAEHSPKSNRYTLKGEVARGGMGAILRVRDNDLRRDLAMKVVLGTDGTPTAGSTSAMDPKTLGRFLEEAQVTGQLDHPGVVPVHELGVDDDGRVYFTMRLVKGRDLKAIFEMVKTGEEGWNRTRALGVLLKACEALAYAHSHGVIHRDLKPANIMVGKFGEVYVMDWGLAKVKGRKDARDLRIRPEGTSTLESLETVRRDEADGSDDSPLITMDGDVMGTPAYMSPEQARGELDALGPRSDVYAMGAILYELLTGQMPYAHAGAKRSPRMILLAVQEGLPEPIHNLARDYPAELQAICERAMQRTPSNRYEDVTHLAEDLRAFLEGHVVSAYETGAIAEFRKWVRRNKSLATGMLLLILVLSSAPTLWQAWRSYTLAELRAEEGQELEGHLSSEVAPIRRRLADRVLSGTASENDRLTLARHLLSEGSFEIEPIQRGSRLVGEFRFTHWYGECPELLGVQVRAVVLCNREHLEGSPALFGPFVSSPSNAESIGRPGILAIDATVPPGDYSLEAQLYVEFVRLERVENPIVTPSTEETAGPVSERLGDPVRLKVRQARTITFADDWPHPPLALSSSQSAEVSAFERSIRIESRWNDKPDSGAFLAVLLRFPRTAAYKFPLTISVARDGRPWNGKARGELRGTDSWESPHPDNREFSFPCWVNLYPNGASYQLHTYGSAAGFDEDIFLFIELLRPETRSEGTPGSAIDIEVRSDVELATRFKLPVYGDIRVSHTALE